MVDKTQFGPYPFTFDLAISTVLFEIWIENDYACVWESVWFYYRFSFSLFYFTLNHIHLSIELMCLCLVSLVGWCMGISENKRKENKNKNRLLNNSWNFRQWNRLILLKERTKISLKMFWILCLVILLVPLVLSMSITMLSIFYPNQIVSSEKIFRCFIFILRTYIYTRYLPLSSFRFILH